MPRSWSAGDGRRSRRAWLGEEQWRERLGARQRATANDGILNLLEAILLAARAEIHRALAEADEHL
jgi:hypothetical protein